MIAEIVEGSADWQRGFFVVAAVVLLWHAFRGWSLGPARQIVHLSALVAAYVAAFVLGGPLTPLLRTVIQLPDVMLHALGGAAVGLVVYLVLLFFGALLLKRTDQQPGALLRVVYGVSGSVLGVVSGCLLLWILVIGLRLIGTIAEARLESEAGMAVSPPPGATAGNARPAPPSPDPEEAPPTPRGPPPVLLGIAAKARRSIELGAAGPVIEAVDVIPPQVYGMLGDLARVVSTPETAQRFLEYPGAAELANHPKLRALQGDPDITFLLERRSYLALLRNEKIIDAANDPELGEALRKFDLRKAMDHALAPPASGPLGPPVRAVPGRGPSPSQSALGTPRAAGSRAATRSRSAPVPSPRPAR